MIVFLVIILNKFVKYHLNTKQIWLKNKIKIILGENKLCKKRKNFSKPLRE